MRGKSLILLIVCLPVCLLSGCRVAYDLPTQPDNSAATGGDTMDHVEMTDKEMELLCQNYQDTDRIREGLLFDYQAQALGQLRAGMSYLAEKYPSQSFEVLTFEAATKFSGRATILFQGGVPGEYTLYVRPSDGEYICTDTFYGGLLREEYDKKVEEALASGGRIGRSYTRFPSPVGVELGEGATADDLFRLFPKLTRDTDLFFVCDDHDAAAKEVQAVLTQAGFYGAYTMYFVQELPPDILVLESGRSDWEYAVFNCFDA